MKGKGKRNEGYIQQTDRSEETDPETIIRQIAADIFVCIHSDDRFKGKQYTISKQGISITENMFVELGYVVKVYDGESYGEYAFSHIDENEIDTIAEEVKIM